ncbi:MAG: hypothetical protein DWQ10_15495 [Calditrichaeota bacterium]|nr:MAG: hypothetical protein DWQ10_15495 [Calditrichota bacterium]
MLLTGARQTGKTTSAQLVYPNLTYFNLDAFEYQEYLDQLSTLEWGETVEPAILDEAQKLPSLFNKIKYAFDAGDVAFSVLLGLAQILLMQQIRETLAGCILIYEL